MAKEAFKKLVKLLPVGTRFRLVKIGSEKASGDAYDPGYKVHAHQKKMILSRIGKKAWISYMRGIEVHRVRETRKGFVINRHWYYEFIE